MKKLRFISWAWGLILISTLSFKSLFAQDQSANISLGADLVSRYIWRGMNTGGSGAHIQPWMEYSVGQSGLAFGAWGSYSLGAGTGTEVDLYMTYTPVAFLTISITDYFFPTDSAFGSSNFFDYQGESTGHTLEAMVRFNGLDGLPLRVLFAMNFYGSDGTDEIGDNYLAKYLELSYIFKAGETSIIPVLGFALDDPKKKRAL